MDLNNSNEKPEAKGLWFHNEETGEWSPVMQVESVYVSLTEEGEANLAAILEPLGNLEIVTKEE